MSEKVLADRYRLVEQIEGERKQTVDLLQPELMIRSSCMAPRARQTKFEEVRP